MQLYIDTANVEEIREIAGWGILSGVTTNPSLAAKYGRPFREVVSEIAAIVDGPISAEVIGLEWEGMVTEGRELAKISPNVVIKIPITPDGLHATKVLSSEGIKVNMTLVFSANQALLAASSGASYVSPFVGRLDDVGQRGMDLVEEIVDIFTNYDISTEVIAASIRHPQHVTEAALAGAHISTIPYSVFKQMSEHPLTEKGIDRFLKDWKALQAATGAKAPVGIG